jgi:hypothetical protein
VTSEFQKRAQISQLFTNSVTPEKKSNGATAAHGLGAKSEIDISHWQFPLGAWGLGG